MNENAIRQHERCPRIAVARETTDETASILRAIAENRQNDGNDGEDK